MLHEEAERTKSITKLKQIDTNNPQNRFPQPHPITVSNKSTKNQQQHNFKNNNLIKITRWNTLKQDQVKFNTAAYPVHKITTLSIRSSQNLNFEHTQFTKSQLWAYPVHKITTLAKSSNKIRTYRERVNFFLIEGVTVIATSHGNWNAEIWDSVAEAKVKWVTKKEFLGRWDLKVWNLLQN